MKIITVANQKGGVGKSAVSVHLAWASAEAGLRTILCDFDAQANSTSTLADDPSGTPASAFFQKTPPVFQPHTVSQGLDLIPADIALGDVEGMALESIMCPKIHIRTLITDYDVMIIDTPPALGRRLLAALIVSDYVVSPLALNGYSIKGLESLQKTIIQVKKKFNPGLSNLGLLPNLVVSRSQTQQALLARLRADLGDRVLPFQLANRVAVSDAIDRQHPVWKYAKGQSSMLAGKEMKAVVGEILRRVEQ